jgi:hypothetical protein
LLRQPQHTRFGCHQKRARLGQMSLHMVRLLIWINVPIAIVLLRLWAAPYSMGRGRFLLRTFSKRLWATGLVAQSFRAIC